MTAGLTFDVPRLTDCQTVRKDFRKYLYEVARVPVTDDGDLQEPSGRVGARNGEPNDTVPANSMALYATAGDDDPPAPDQS